jgi:hypothetical protein
MRAASLAGAAMADKQPMLVLTLLLVWAAIPMAIFTSLPSHRAKFDVLTALLA